MTGAIVIVAVLALIGLVAVLMFRAERGPVPRRRELNQLRDRYARAGQTIVEVKQLVRVWRPSMIDDAGAAFLDAVEERLHRFDDYLIEKEKKEK